MINPRSYNNRSTMRNPTLSLEDRNIFPKLLPFAFLAGVMINPQWLELPISRIHFHGFKDIRAIEVRLYLFYRTYKDMSLLSRESHIFSVSHHYHDFYSYPSHLSNKLLKYMYILVLALSDVLGLLPADTNSKG